MACAAPSLGTFGEAGPEVRLLESANRPQLSLSGALGRAKRVHRVEARLCVDSEFCKSRLHTGFPKMLLGV